ncbi:hypothetical protein JGU66_02930 [Myxococcaceae bacterium JPH2]|nr:hypothetical protein [Myxococcaceae bacterium JPH2]
MSPPRYFIPHAASPAEPARMDASAMTHAVDAFTLDAPYLGDQEFIVGTDIVGNVLVVPARERDTLASSIQAQLAHHEVASARPPRRLDAHALFFFSIELVEHPANAEGLNDPVYLYGTLTGPWPGESTVRVPGQLTVTRGDVLAAFTRCAPDAFQYARDAESKDVPRGYHALLPGDRPAALSEGHGLVLAYPAVPAELQSSHAANGPQVASLLHDVLAQLQADAREHGGMTAFASRELPVPSRALAIAELELRGYEVTGDVAQQKSSRPGLAGKLAEWLHGDKVKVPREAPPTEFLELAQNALEALPGWPSETERILRARSRPGSGVPVPRSVPSAPPAAARVIPPRAPQPPPRPSDWMQDFLDAHATQRGAKSTVTRLQAPARAPERKASTPERKAGSPDWMTDFASGPPAPARPRPRAEAPRAAPAPAGKPDWMKDFDD